MFEHMRGFNNYNRFPATKVEGRLFKGWEAIVKAIKAGAKGPVAVDSYTGVYEHELLEGLSPGFTTIIKTSGLMKSEGEIRRMTQPFMTDDVLYGYVTNLRIGDFFNQDKLEAARKELAEAGPDTLIIGTGAALVAPDNAARQMVEMLNNR